MIARDLPLDNSVLQKAARFSVERPWVVLLLAALMTVVGACSATRLQIKTSNLDLIDHSAPIVRDFLQFAGRFGTPNTLVLVLHGDDTSKLRQVVDEIGPMLRSISGMRRVVERVVADVEAYGNRELSSYLVSKDAKAFYLFLQPEDATTDVTRIAPFVEMVRKVAGDYVATQPGLRWGITGIPQYALDDKEIIQGDIAKLSVISLVLNVGLFVWTFGSLRRPLIANAALVPPMSLSLAFAAVYPGYLTLLSAPFVMMIFGLGIDYGTLIVSHVEELVAAGKREKEALVESVVSLARSISTACLTTAGGFFTLCFSGFRGFAELGIISGVSLLLCLPAMLFVLPAALTVFRWGSQDTASGTSALGSATLAIQKRRWIGPLVLCLSLCALLAGHPGFDGNYLNLQPADSEAASLEREMVEHSDYSPYFAAFTTASIEQAVALTKRLRKEPLVGAVRSIADFQTLMGDGGVETLPPEISGVFNSADGRFAVYAFPAVNIWNPVEEAAFLERMRTMDPEVTGMPFLGNFMIGLTRHALQVTTVLAALILLLVVFLDFKRPFPALLVTLSPVLAVPWMHVIMKLLGLSYNPLNVMALPIILGTAVDGSVHLMHRFLQEQGDMRATLSSSARGVVLTALTTLAGFGALAFTSHRGLRSFSLILSAGIAAALLISLTLLPWLMVRFGSRLLPTDTTRQTL